MSDHTSFCTTVQETENGDIILEFPDEILDMVGWTEGDELEFAAIGDSIRITKVEGRTGDSGKVSQPM